MNYWLIKSDPETFGWNDLEKIGTSMWDGVRNFQARNNLRIMKKGDTVFFYHSGKDTGIVGLVEVVKEYYPDPTATEGDWTVVDIKKIKKLNRFISLEEIKQSAPLKNMALVKNTRLSVQPVTKEEYTFIMELTDRK